MKINWYNSTTITRALLILICIHAHTQVAPCFTVGTHTLPRGRATKQRQAVARVSVSNKVVATRVFWGGTLDC